MFLLSLKLIHIFFVISFLAGVFYLPRILVHFQLAKKSGQQTQRLQIMASKLFYFSVFTGLIAISSGLLLVYQLYSFATGWVLLKMFTVFLLILYFLVTGFYVFKIKKNNILPGSVLFWRIFNEVSIFLVLLVLYAVIFKP